MKELKKEVFEIGQGYDIPQSNGGSISIECVARTGKTVTFKYNDGEKVVKRVDEKMFDLISITEIVKFGNTIVTA